MGTWTRSIIDLEGEPLIPLATVRRFCRLPGTDDDPQLELLVPAAVTLVERDTRWQLEPAEYSIELGPHVREVPLPKGPYVSATLQTVSGDVVTVVDAPAVHHDGRHPGTLTLPRVTTAHDHKRLTVRIGAWPLEKLTQVLVCTLVAHWFEHPEAATADGKIDETPLSYRHIIRSLDPMADGVRIAGAV